MNMALFSSKAEDANMQDQRKLLEAEKEYKTGLNTLKEFNRAVGFAHQSKLIEGFGQTGPDFLCAFLPTIYFGLTGWRPWLAWTLAMDMSMFVYPMDTERNYEQTSR